MTSAGDDSHSRTEDEAAADQPVGEPVVRSAARQSINWKLIFLLAGLGLLIAIINQQEFTQELAKGLPSWFNLALSWLILPGSFAGWIIKQAPARHLLHGFLTGFLYNIAAAGGWFIFGYLGDTPALREFSAQIANYPSAVRVLSISVSIVVGSVMMGLCCGFLAWVFGKAVKAREVK